MRAIPLIQEITALMQASAGQGHTAGVTTSTEAYEFYEALVRLIDARIYEAQRDHSDD